MAAILPGESSQFVTSDSGHSRSSQDRPEDGGRWYFARKEIEENSPSRRDGIDLKKETYLRKSYCTFLQDLGMRLKVPQVTIATAIIFCHRFFIRQSHGKNDRRTIATVCMFLAGKVEETPRPLKDVILVSYEIIHKKDPTAAQKIKQKEVYEQQKELILLGERVVLATLGFDLNVHHPYKPLVEAIKKFKVAQNALAQVAWNFVNDGLRTSLCLQFKPHHIAAGAIFLAAKFLKVKLPSEGEKIWWQEFDVTPRQLEEVSNQMLELYEQNRVPPSQGSEIEESTGGGPTNRASSKALTTNEEHASKQSLPRSATENSHGESHGTQQKSAAHSRAVENGSGEAESVITDHKMDPDAKEDHTFHRENLNRARSVGENQGRETCSAADRSLDSKDGPDGQSPKDPIKMIDKDKVRAALEKRRKSRGETARKKDVMDEDDLIERELEDGIELAAEDEKVKSERKQGIENGEINNETRVTSGEAENAEEGEMIDDGSPLPNSRKRKSGSSPAEKHPEGKKKHEYVANCNQDSVDEGHRVGRGGYADREHRRHAHAHAQESHL